MPKYICDPNAEIIGQNLLSTTIHINKESVQPFLIKHGLDQIDPEQWYPLSKWMAVLNDIAEHGGGSTDFVSLGLAIAQTAVLPPEIEKASFEEFCQGMDYAYQMNHRGGDVGHYHAEIISPKHVKVTVTAPYPDDQAYGVLYGFARRFLPKGSRFTVQYDPDVARKEEGGIETIIHIKWDE